MQKESSHPDLLRRYMNPGKPQFCVYPAIAGDTSWASSRCVEDLAYGFWL